MAKSEYKDGVTLMAEAIRRENEEALKEAQKKAGQSNVSVLTAQFSNKQTTPSSSNSSPSPSQTAKAEESDDASAEPNGSNTDDESDGTI